VNGTPFRAVTHEEALKVSPTFLTTAAFLESPTLQLRPPYLLILAAPLAPLKTRSQSKDTSEKIVSLILRRERSWGINFLLLLFTFFLSTSFQNLQHTYLHLQIYTYVGINFMLYREILSEREDISKTLIKERVRNME